MKHFAEISLKPVMDDIIRFVPEKYKTTYRNWLENIQDWCISRQLWWGHRIPAYYYTDPADGQEHFVVAENKDAALRKVLAKDSCAGLSIEDLRQDEGALDTWFSSWLWPITLFDGINNPGNEEINYYYPTSTLVTGPDIIFFWVARMIFSGLEHMGQKPLLHRHRARQHRPQDVEEPRQLARPSRPYLHLRRRRRAHGHDACGSCRQRHHVR